MKEKKYHDRCSVCQFMKTRKDYRIAIMNSKYFDPGGIEGLIEVNERYGAPFKLPTLYRHLQRHQSKDIERSERLAKIEGKETPHQRRRSDRYVTPLDPAFQNTTQIIETDDFPKKEYEVGLDEFIKLGRDRLKHGEMAVSAANFIAAIKTKADIERSNKDRRLEMLKTMFAGAAPEGTSDTSDPS
jgi:hypothetical protein